MTQPNLVLVEIDGADPVNVTSLVGLTDTILIDWGSIRSSSSLSTEEALQQIATYKMQVFPWKDQVPAVWKDLLELEEEWLDAAASDDHLTYTYGRDA